MFSQTEILLMIFVVSFLLIFIIILTILDIKEYRKNKNVLEFSEDVDTELEEPLQKSCDEVTIMEVEDNIHEKVEEVKNEINDNELFMEEEEIIPVKIEKKEEEITYNDYQEEMPKRVNLNEELIKVEETMVEESDIDNKALSFEEEQERTAIISIDELLEKSNDLYNENEYVQYDDGNEPISIDEVINMYNKEEKEISIPEVREIVEEKKETKELYTKKEEIPFISSIYGVEKNEMSFENTATYEKLDRAKSNEFMRELREKIENQ